MAERDSDAPLSRLLLIIAAIVVIIWGTRQAQPVLVSFLLALFLAVLATPPVLWLERRRVPPVLAVSLVILGMVLVLLAIGALVGASIGSFYATLPHYQARFQEQATTIRAFLLHHGIASPGEIFLKYVNPASVMNLTADLLMGLGLAFSNIVLILLTTTFILLEASSFPIKLRTILGDPDRAFPRFTGFLNNLKRYMVIKTLLSLATGLLVGIWLAILQVDFPVLWGFLAFLLNYVPSIGSTLASIPAVILTFIQFGSGRAILAAAGCTAINLVLDYGVEKRWMGRKLGLSTLVVFLSLIFWGSLLGPVGAVLCIPLSLTLKFAFESRENTRWIAVLLGPEVVTEAPH
jgi:predicted PurR-regulated permease PerM